MWGIWGESQITLEAETSKWRKWQWTQIIEKKFIKNMFIEEMTKM